jgi:plastocyanin
MTRFASLLLAVAAAAALPSSGMAVPSDWARAAPVHVDLSSFKFSPGTIHMKAGQPVLLHLVNTSSGGHDFTAREFFAAASVRPADAAKLRKGAIALRGHQSAEIALVPKAGRYPLRCGHSFHSTLGMKGTIVVD